MTQDIRVGGLDWSRQELVSFLPDFLKIYNDRPIKDNQGGMRSPHMFAFYVFLKKLNPSIVIESGVWRGQGTWLIEQALPNAKIHCIDLNLHERAFISKKATYYGQDFESIDWGSAEDKSKTLLFFDDHQNAIARLHAGKKLGFHHFIFEDNYPATSGDCYSLKKAFAHAGFNWPPKENFVKSIVRQLLGRSTRNSIKPNSTDAAWLNSNLETYYEFPPVFKSAKTRWGDDWSDERYPTPAPILKAPLEPAYSLFSDDADSYTWMCYAQLK